MDQALKGQSYQEVCINIHNLYKHYLMGRRKRTQPIVLPRGCWGFGEKEKEEREECNGHVKEKWESKGASEQLERGEREGNREKQWKREREVQVNSWSEEEREGDLTLQREGEREWI